MEGFTITANKKDFREIMKRLIQKYGEDAKLIDVLQQYETKKLGLC